MADGAAAGGDLRGFTTGHGAGGYPGSESRQGCPISGLRELRGWVMNFDIGAESQGQHSSLDMADPRGSAATEEPLGKFWESGSRSSHWCCAVALRSSVATPSCVPRFAPPHPIRPASSAPVSRTQAGDRARFHGKGGGEPMDCLPRRIADAGPRCREGSCGRGFL